MTAIYRKRGTWTSKFAALALALMGLAGCLVPGPGQSDTSNPAPPQTQTLPQPGTGHSPGRLAYLGADGNVYVTTADRSSTLAVTSDATAPVEGQGLSYHRLAWSPDGRLAFAAVIRSGDKATSKLYVVESPGQPPRLVAQDDQHFVIYVYWSPVPCSDKPACQRLAYLIEESNGVGLHVLELVGNQVEDRLVGVGRPFYFSWSPDGRHILWHADGARREADAARIALYDVERDQVENLPPQPGPFLAPGWSPTGDGWLLVTATGELDQLQRLPVALRGASDLPPLTTLATAHDAQMSFAWSPGGDRVAFAVQEDRGSPFYGPIQVFDLDTGTSRQLTQPGFRILAFFWSPDGQRLGYLIHLALPDADWMQWRTYDLSMDRDRGFTAFQPSPMMRFMVHSFNQYAQSHRFWSPDGRYLVYADRDRSQIDHVWLVDTTAEKGADPILVDQGSLGVWSWK
jgi:TolB protein